MSYFAFLVEHTWHCHWKGAIGVRFETVEDPEWGPTAPEGGKKGFSLARRPALEMWQSPPWQRLAPPQQHEPWHHLAPRSKPPEPEPAARAPPRYAKQMRSRVDEVVFGRDVDRSLLATPPSRDADDEDLWRRRRAARADRADRGLAPQMQSNVDELVFGRDVDGSAGALDGGGGGGGGVGIDGSARAPRARTEWEGRHGSCLSRDLAPAASRVTVVKPYVAWCLAREIVKPVKTGGIS